MTKFLVSLILFAGLIVMIFTAFDIVRETNGDIEMLFEDNYIESRQFKEKNETLIHDLQRLVTDYKSKENILAGHTVDEHDLEYRLEEIYWEDEEKRQNKDNIARVKKTMIQEDLNDFQTTLKRLKSEETPLYYATDSEHTFKNTEDVKQAQFEALPVYFVSDGYQWELYPDSLWQMESLTHTTDFSISDNWAEGNDKIELYLGYTDQVLSAQTEGWKSIKKDLQFSFYLFLSGFIAFILGLIYLIMTTGQAYFGDRKIKLNTIDKLFVDLNLLIITGLFVMWFVMMQEFTYLYGIESWVTVLTTVPFGIMILLCLLSVVRHLKHGTFLKHTLTFTVLKGLYQWLSAIYENGSLGVKVTVVVILYPILTAATVIFFPIVIGIAVWLAMKKVKTFNEIQSGAALMKAGKLNHRIEIEDKGELKILAENINGINAGFEEAVFKELKNERLKTELITNVSHDIRTPLTSLITYTDLLKQETDPEKMRAYIDVLDEKSQRLKVLTDDLFEAAKASSGDIPVDLQAIDLVALVNQGIGEMTEQITAKGLNFKLSQSSEKINVMADGKLLWRAIENVFSNIFRYAQENSRVYIDIEKKGDLVNVSFKNISAHELNITPDELMERFKRGDEARTSEGSGLGLSITKSLIENQGGQFNVVIDGDLFKAMIELKKV